MVIGRLVMPAVYISGAFAILLLAVTAPAISNLYFSGRELCFPLSSIKCHYSDCGRYFIRCGKEIESVPEGKVCYQGTLIPAERTDLHSCDPSSPVELPDFPVTCNCNFCSTQSVKCRCLCFTQSPSSVYSNLTNKFYRNSEVAQCCGVKTFVSRGTACNTLFEGSKQPLESWLEWVWFAVRKQIADMEAAFTFHSPPVGSKLHAPVGSDVSPGTDACCVPNDDPLYVKCCENVC